MTKFSYHVFAFPKALMYPTAVSAAFPEEFPGLSLRLLSDELLFDELSCPEVSSDESGCELLSGRLLSERLLSPIMCAVTSVLPSYL